LVAGPKGYTVAQTIGFVGALMDVAAERSQQLPVCFVPADCEPRRQTMLGRWFGR
jgi:hypothetical protein